MIHYLKNIIDESNDEIAQEDSEELLEYNEDESQFQAAEDSNDILSYYSSGGIEIELYNYVDITSNIMILVRFMMKMGLKELYL